MKTSLFSLIFFVTFVTFVTFVNSAIKDPTKKRLIDELEKLLNNSFSDLEDEISVIHLHIYLGDNTQSNTPSESDSTTREYSCSYETSSDSCICDLQ